MFCGSSVLVYLSNAQAEAICEMEANVWKQTRAASLPVTAWVTKMYSTGPAYCMLSWDCQFRRL